MKTLFRSKLDSLFLVAAVIVPLLGCSTVNTVEQAQNKSVQEIQTLQQQSAGIVPCPSYQIEIPQHEINRTDGSAKWTAYCFGKTYKCGRTGKDQNVTCEEIPPQGME
jgi:hypothetical protein